MIRLAFAVALALSACTDLASLGVCGNGVVEPDIGEDCDGDSAACVACRLVCEPAAEHPDATCPAGFVCGKDAICRQPSGYFARPPRLVDVDGDTLDVADVDYDGYADLIGFGDHGAGVVYGSAELDLARADQLPAPPPAHVDSQVAILRGGVGEDTPVHDVFVGAAIPVRFGMAAMLDIGGELLALPVPGLFAVLDTFDIDSIALFNGFIVLSGRLTGTSTTVLLALNDNPVPDVPCGVDVPSLALPPAVGRRSPVFDVMAVAPTPNTICVYDIDTLLGAPPIPVAFTGTAAHIMFADRVPGDCADLVVTHAAGATSLFPGTIDGAGRCSYQTSSLLPAIPDGVTVLAAGRLDTDGVDDLLLSDGTVLRAGDKLTVGLPYTNGAIVDINNDGLGDLVTGSTLHPDFDVLTQLSPDVFAHRIVRTAQPVGMIRTADFDGDTFPDVIVVGAPQLDQTGQLPDADVGVLFGGPAGLTDQFPVAHVPRPTVAVADRMALNENLGALVTVNDDINGASTRTFSLFLGSTNRGIASASILKGTEARTAALGPDDGSGRPQLWEMSFVVEPRTGDQNECAGITEACIAGAWLYPGSAAQVSGTAAASFLRDFDVVTDATPWFVAGTVNGVSTAIGVRRGKFGTGATRASELILIPAPTTSDPVLVLPGTELTVLPDDGASTRKISSVRAIELDGDADSELLLIADDGQRHIPYLVTDLAAGSPAVDLTAGADYDCPDGTVIAGPDGAPVLVLACAAAGGDQAAALFAVLTTEAPPRFVQIGQLDHAGRIETGDVNGDGLVDLVVHNNRVDGRAAGVAVQCSHYHTAPCIGDQRPPFAFGPGDAP